MSPSIPTQSTSTDGQDAVRVEPELKTYRYKTLGGRELVPALPIRLRGLGGDLQPSVLAILDSGADCSTFPTSWADGLGIKLDLSVCEKATAKTAAGPATLWTYPQGIKALVDGAEHHLKADFCEGLDVALLGRRDFFDAYRITFDQRATSFTLEPLGPRDWSKIGPRPRFS